MSRIADGGAAVWRGVGRIWVMLGELMPAKLRASSGRSHAFRANGQHRGPNGQHLDGLGQHLEHRGQHPVRFLCATGRDLASALHR